MKYFIRKLRLIRVMYRNVKGDKCRTQELNSAIIYILLHPSHMFVKKRIESNHDSVLKNVNVITNMPYYEEMYETVLHG